MISNKLSANVSSAVVAGLGGAAITVAASNPGPISIINSNKVIAKPKVVVALYTFKAIESGDLSLEKVIFY